MLPFRGLEAVPGPSPGSAPRTHCSPAIGRWRCRVRPLKRKPINKHKAAHGFRKSVSRTHPHNIKPMPMRGGWRL